jgi:hypothetical protein
MGPIAFGECLIADGWIHVGEVDIFKFKFDYIYLVKNFNDLAKEKGWQEVPNGDKMTNVWTQMPCNARSIHNEQLNEKVTKHRPDQYIMEYDHFFRLLSYYLPSQELRNNPDFVNWLRHTPKLAD